MAWSTKHPCVGNTVRTPNFGLYARVIGWQAGDAKFTARVRVIVTDPGMPGTGTVMNFPAPAVGLPA